MHRPVLTGGLYTFLAALKTILILQILGIAQGPFLFPFIFQLLLHAALLAGIYCLGFRKKILIFWGIEGLYFLILLGYHLIYHRVFNVFLDYHVAGDGLDIVFKGFLPLSSAMLLILIDLPALLALIFLSPGGDNGFYHRRLPGGLRGGVLLFSVLLLSCLALPQEAGWGALSWSFGRALDLSSPGFLETGLATTKEPGSASGGEANATEAELREKTASGESLSVPAATVLHPRPIPIYPPFEGIFPEADLPEAPNFLLIQFESLQTGLPELTHNGRPVMPFLNRLIDEGIYFPYCFAYHRKGGSSDCEIAIFNNMDPGDRMLMRSSRYPHDRSFLKQLKPLGYEAYGFHDYEKEFYNRGDSYSRIGFDGFFDYYDMKMGPPKWAAQDGEMFDFISSLPSPESPVLSYVITVSSHVGYNHIITYHENSLFDDVARKRDRHALLCFNYTDQELERFVNTIQDKYPNTYIFIYGDHSTPTVFFDGDLAPSFFALDDMVMEFVPLIILPPRELGLTGRRYPEVLASFLDIGPTILDLSGALDPEESENNTENNPLTGGSLLSVDVNKLPIPYDNKRLDRSFLLSEIRDLIPQPINNL